MPLRARGLSVSLGGRQVLRNVALDASPGEVLALLGPNGAGKSTLLKALAGLLPYEGTVMLGDAESDSLSPRARARRVSYVPQRSLLRSALSVEEVVALGRYVHGGSFGGLSKDDREAIEHAMETAHADVLRGRIFTQLSVGEQQRVLLARALASDAPILLLDEPTAGVDPVAISSLSNPYTEPSSQSTDFFSGSTETAVCPKMISAFILSKKSTRT